MIPSTGPPAAPETMTFISSVLDHRSPNNDQVFKMSMALSTSPSNPSIEPLPQLDYYLINSLVALARPHLTKHQLKRIEYMVDSRRSFYESHHKFQVAYRDLLDAYACAETLDAKVETLKHQLTDALAPAPAVAAGNNGPADDIRRQLVAIDVQRQGNNEDMRACLERLQAKTKNRQSVAVLFSDLKVVFVKNEMPWLIAFGKQAYAAAMKQKEEGRSPATPSSNERNVLDRDDSDHCSDSEGTSTPDVDMPVFELELGVNGAEEEEIL